MKKARKGRSKLILVLGGAASGKSQAALDLAGQGRTESLCGNRPGAGSGDEGTD